MVVVLPGGVGSKELEVVVVVFPFPKTPIVFKDIIKIIIGLNA